MLDKAMTHCWILTEAGLTGTQNQCVALARACGWQFEIKSIQLRQPWKSLTPWWRHFAPMALTHDSAPLTAPWPNVVIASGRKAIAASLWVKKQSNCKLIIVQSPVIKDARFDLVIVPEHDKYNAPNAITITGALPVVTEDVVSAAKQEWQATFESLPSPRVAVLIGGNSRAHRMDDAVAARLQAQLVALAAGGNGVMITCSRRTPIAYREAWRVALAAYQNVFFWDGRGANPYNGMLAWADVVLVTEDSVSMASEAIATGRSVYLLRLSGGSRRFKRFHEAIVTHGFARWFEGRIETWHYKPPNDVERIKAILTSNAAAS